MKMMPDRVMEGLGQMIDRPVPRAALAVLAIGALEGLLYGGHALFDETTAEQRADIVACARQLDPSPEGSKVSASELPDACESFRTSFSYLDTVVTVVGGGGDVKSQPTSYTKTFYLPSAADFRHKQNKALTQKLKDEAGGEGLQIGIGLGAFSLPLA